MKVMKNFYSRYAFSIVITFTLIASLPAARAGLDGTGQYTLGTLSSIPLQVGVTAQGTFTISGCECSPDQQELVRADALVGTGDGGDGLLTLVNEHPAFGEVALRINHLLRVGAISYNTTDVGLGRMVIGPETVVIGNKLGGNRFSPNESAEFGGPVSHPAEVVLRGRMISFDLITVGHYGEAVLDIIGPQSQFSPNGLTIGDRGHGVVNLREGADVLIAGLDFANIGEAGELNIQDDGTAFNAQSAVTLRGSGDGSFINVKNGGRFTVFAHVSTPDLALIEGTGGGFYSPGHLNVIYDDFNTLPPRVECIDMSLRHTHVLASGPGATIDLSGTFQTFGAGHTPVVLRIKNGAEMTCAEFVARGYNNSLTDPDLFLINGANSSLHIDGQLGLAIGDTIRNKMSLTHGATLSAGEVVITQPVTNIRTEGHLELSGGSSLTADSIDVAMTAMTAFGVEGSLKVCDSSVADVAGAVNIGAKGTLQGSGTIIAGGGIHNNGGTVISGCSPGDLNIDGDFDQPNGKLELTAGNGGPNRLIVSGDTNIAGNIKVIVQDNILPDSNFTIQMIEGTGNVTIDPSTQITIDTLEVFRFMNAEVIPSATGVELHLEPKPGRAEIWLNGVVDLTDYYYLWDCFRNGGPGQSTCRDGDIDGDGDVDLRDAQIMMLSFGEEL